MSNLKLTFIVDKQKVRNQKFFVYKNKKYPIDFDLLIKNSNYFYKYRQQYEEVEDIELLNDTKDEYNFPDESIEAFVNCCQNKQCEIESTSIFSLQYLSSKYEYPEIITITNEFIKEHSDELVYESLLFKTRQIKIKEEHNFIDTSNEEEIISRNLDKYIDTNKNMTQLPIPILNRIISKYFEQQKDNKNKQQNTKIINFLFDVLKEKGTEGSILFNNIDFGEENIGVINKLLNEYSNIFDFNMINSTLLKTTNQITNEMNKQQEEYSKLFSNMKKEFELQKEEIYKIQNEAIKHRDEYENRLKQLENKYQEEIMNIKKDNEMIIVQLEERFQKMKEEYEHNIKNGKHERYQQILHEIITTQEFDILSSETKQIFIQKIIENEQNKLNKNNENNKLIKNILFFNQLFDQMPQKEESRNSFIEKQIKENQIKYEQIETLFSKGKLQNVIKELFEISTDINIEIKYPNNKFETILQILFDIKTQHIKENYDNKSQLITKIYDNENKQICQFSQQIIFLNKEIYESFIKSTYEGLNTNNFEVFCNCKCLTNISIPSSMISIGSYVFYCCSSLKEIIIPSSVKSIQEYAFHKCSSLKRISIPSSVTSIGWRAFKRCSSLTQVSFESPSLLTSIGSDAFKGCSSLTQISIPSSVTKIGGNAFKKCRSITKISIPSSVTEIGYGAFSECSSLTQILIPSSVTKIWGYAFSECISLTQITIPSFVTEIGDYAFNECSSLKQIVIPSTVTLIGNYAFRQCTLLEQILILSPVAKIGYSILSECSSIKQIKIPSSLNVSSFGIGSNVNLVRI